MHSIAERIVEIGGFEDPVVICGGVAEYFPGVLRGARGALGREGARRCPSRSSRPRSARRSGCSEPARGGRDDGGRVRNWRAPARSARRWAPTTARSATPPSARRRRSPGARASARRSCCGRSASPCFFPENHAAMLGAARTANRYLPRGPRAGLLAGHLLVPDERHRRVPRGRDAARGVRPPRARRAPTCWCSTPTSAATCATGSSGTAATWNVPVIGINSPRCVGEVTDADVDAVARQLEALVPRARGGGRHAARRARGWRRRSRASRECSDLWERLPRDGRAPARRRSPSSTAPSTWDRRSSCAARRGGRDYYRTLLAELEERARDGVAGGARRVVPALLGRDADLGPAAGALDDCSPSSGRPSSRRPTATAGSSRRSTPPIRCARWRAPRWSCSSRGPRSPRSGTSSAWSELYDVDGIVFHDCRTCPNNSNTRYGMPRRLSERLGIPDAGARRRRQRPALLLRRAVAHQHRGIRRAARRRARGRRPGERADEPATPGSTAARGTRRPSSSTTTARVLGTSVVRSGADLDGGGRAGVRRGAGGRGRATRRTSRPSGRPASAATPCPSPTARAPNSTATGAARRSTSRGRSS